MAEKTKQCPTVLCFVFRILIFFPPKQELEKRKDSVVANRIGKFYAST